MKYYSLDSALVSVVQQAFAYAKVYMMGRRIANGSVILAAKRPTPRGLEILVKIGNGMEWEEEPARAS
jgi:hypothetical protein